MTEPVFKSFEQVRDELITSASETSQCTDWNPGAPNRSILEALATGLAGGYFTMEQVMDIHFLTTAGFEYLKKYADEMNSPWDSGQAASGYLTCARSTPAPFGELIPAGTTFQTPDGKLTIKTTEDKNLLQGESSVQIAAAVTTVGMSGLLQTGTALKQVGVAVSLIETVTVTAPGFTGGRDPESEAQLRGRLLTLKRSPGTSGNKAQYVKWALDIAGIGNAYPEPLWNGRGTVKLYLIDTNKQPAAADLVQQVQDYIDPVPHGTGSGVGPIGAIVTAVAAPAVNIDITATVVLDTGKTLADVIPVFSAAVSSHLREIAYSDDTTVRWSKIGTLLSTTSGVIDYSNLTLNGVTANVIIPAGSVAVLGAVNLT